MARTTTRRPQDDVEDEEEVIGDEAEEQEESRPSAPAVSDSRRRREMKRGEKPKRSVQLGDDGELVDDEEDDSAGQITRKDRPTPSQREVVKSSNVVVRFFQSFREYLKDTASELRKVAWLTREDTLRLTYIVLIVTSVSAAVLGLISFLFGWLTTQLAQANTGLIAGAITIVMVVLVGGLWLFRDRLFGTHLE